MSQKKDIVKKQSARTQPVSMNSIILHPIIIIITTIPSLIANPSLSSPYPSMNNQKQILPNPSSQMFKPLKQ